jgi:NADH-quinone oxidoreductase subunit C
MSDEVGSDTTEEASESDDDGVPEPERRYGCLVSSGLDMAVLHPERDQWLPTMGALFSDGFDMCIDLTAVDYLTYDGQRRLPAGIEPERFEVVASFLCFERRERIRTKVQVPADDAVVASATSVYPGADFLEREVFDLFGIEFADHPDLSRILMPESWIGHPLRKDYATGAIPVQFKGAPGPR